MSELPEGIPRAVPPEPVDSALAVLARRDREGVWTYLMGRRSPGSPFMPGHLAFPGGKLEPADEPGRPDALKRCASRELAEEAGVEVPSDQWIEAGERITPPIFPVRFRARLFVARAPEGYRPPPVPPSPREVESLEFLRAGDLLRAWDRGEALVPPPVLSLLRGAAEEETAGIERLASRFREVNRREEEIPRIEFVPGGVWMPPVASRTLPPATHTNVWMPGGRSFVVVDPGSGEPGELRRLAGVIERRRKEGSSPVSILLTHHHGDHVAGAGGLAKELGVPIRAHAKTLSLLHTRWAGVRHQELADGEVLDLEGLELRALHTPGHAPGHLAFHLPGRDVLIAGDLVSGLSTILIDPASGEMGSYLDSLRKMKALRCRTLLPSHGPPLPAKALDRLLEHRAEREERIRESLARRPRALAEIAREAYRDAPEMPGLLTERQTLSHLLHLEKGGKARREGERWKND